MSFWPDEEEDFDEQPSPEELARIEREMQALKAEGEKLEIEGMILQCEILKEQKSSFADFIKANRLSHFARIKIEKKQFISKVESEIYAKLNGLSNRKAAEIAKEFNLYMRLFRYFGKPDKVVKNLISTLPIN